MQASTLSREIFKKRRTTLWERVKAKRDDSVILIFGAYETERYLFRQESSFYYLTGVTEPGAVLALYPDGQQILYVPNFGNKREQWVTVFLQASHKDGGASAQAYGFEEVRFLGEEVAGYSLDRTGEEAIYRSLITDLKELKSLFCTLVHPRGTLYAESWQRARMLLSFLGLPESTVCDIAPLLHEMRRIKDEHEIALLESAIDITGLAQQAACQALRPGLKEYQIRALIEKTFIYEGAVRPSFPSIVATGANTTVLHYTDLNHTLQAGDLVVVDIGAEYGYYAADITRTYPVSGKCTPRQQKIYDLVLETQEYVASLAKPGMYLKNPDVPELSLHHCAVKFLQKAGYDKYFVHGIGHYLGLDVHDVGTLKTPLQPGDVITIEPGIYISQESIGVRIEDDYLITADGCRCLGPVIPK